jgi:hypothetical protein
MRMNSVRWAIVFALCLAIFSVSARAIQADNWQNGDLTTYGSSDWVSDPNAINLLYNNFSSVYASTSGTLVAGDPANFVLIFSGPVTLSEYLPSSGVAGPLDSTLGDPETTSAGIFGGDVIALQLDVNFSDAHLLPGNTGDAFGDLVLEGFTVPGVNGMTVRQFLAIDEIELGGGGGPFDINSIEPSIVQPLAGAFSGGTATAFAEEHLVSSTTVPVVPAPEPSSLLLLVAPLVSLGTAGYWQRRHGRRPANRRGIKQALRTFVRR